jgi:hypothetical protein
LRVLVVGAHVAPKLAVVNLLQRVGCFGVLVPVWLVACGKAAPGTAGDGSPDTTSVVGPGCTTTGRVICDPTPTRSVPAGPAVIVTQGAGSPPEATGGAVTPGPYQLASETIYGTSPENVLGTSAGDSVVQVLTVSCDVFNVVYVAMVDGTISEAGGNACGRLVPQALSLAEVSGLVDGGDEWNDEFPYSATAETLTIITLYPYDGPDGVLGSYTIVQEYALVSSGLAEKTTDAAPPEASAPASQPRDPRCPASAPSRGDSCDPTPAPLECEYGGNAEGQCTTSAICTLQPTDVFAFAVSTDTSCGANPATCPAAFGEPFVPDAASLDTDGGTPTDSPCGQSGLSCTYAEGACACLPQFRDGGIELEWTCRARSSVSPCPSARPLAGDGCSDPNEICAYTLLCAEQPSLGPSMTCLNGYWEFDDEVANCPAEP